MFFLNFLLNINYALSNTQSDVTQINGLLDALTNESTLSAPENPCSGSEANENSCISLTDQESNFIQLDIFQSLLLKYASGTPLSSEDKKILENNLPSINGMHDSLLTNLKNTISPALNILKNYGVNITEDGEFDFQGSKITPEKIKSDSDLRNALSQIFSTELPELLENPNRKDPIQVAGHVFLPNSSGTSKVKALPVHKYEKATLSLYDEFQNTLSEYIQASDNAADWKNRMQSAGWNPFSSEQRTTQADVNKDQAYARLLSIRNNLQNRYGIPKSSVNELNAVLKGVLENEKDKIQSSASNLYLSTQFLKFGSGFAQGLKDMGMEMVHVLNDTGATAFTLIKDYKNAREYPLSSELFKSIQERGLGGTAKAMPGDILNGLIKQPIDAILRSDVEGFGKAYSGVVVTALTLKASTAQLGVAANSLRNGLGTVVLTSGRLALRADGVLQNVAVQIPVISKTAITAATAAALIAVGSTTVGGICLAPLKLVNPKINTPAPKQVQTPRREYHIPDKKGKKDFKKQIFDRGWTDELIDHTIQNPVQKGRTVDARRSPDGTALNDPASVYFDMEGNYIIINDITNEVFQVSDRLAGLVDKFKINPKTGQIDFYPDTWGIDPRIEIYWNKYEH